MNTASHKTLQVLEQIVKPVPVGTNIALLQLMWAIISGAFLGARGAVHPALDACGFSVAEIRRSWRSLRSGQWHIHELQSCFREIVKADGQWQAIRYAGLRPVAVDLTAIWRPCLRDWPGKMFRRIAQKKKTGIGFGLIADVGTVRDHRLPLIRSIVRGITASESETTLQQRTLRKVAGLLEEDEAAIHDAGVCLGEIHEAGIKQYVVRQRSNATARRNVPKPYKGCGRRPKFGEYVRPLSRTRMGKEIAATPDDYKEEFTYEERTILAREWQGLVRTDQHAAADNQTFSLWVLDDPVYNDPWVLATNLNCSPKDVYELYRQRWPVEHIPLVAKQLLGMQRQFVFAHQSCWRLGELAFLVGNILTWLAATLFPIASGFWDRQPKRTPGRLRRRLSRTVLANELLSDPTIRKKESVTAHLPKGIEAHRRAKPPD